VISFVNVVVDLSLKMSQTNKDTVKVNVGSAGKIEERTNTPTGPVTAWQKYVAEPHSGYETMTQDMEGQDHHPSEDNDEK
jgi:hypothetical protein